MKVIFSTIKQCSSVNMWTSETNNVFKFSFLRYLSLILKFCLIFNPIVEKRNCFLGVLSIVVAQCVYLEFLLTSKLISKKLILSTYKAFSKHSWFSKTTDSFELECI